MLARWVLLEGQNAYWGMKRAKHSSSSLLNRLRLTEKEVKGWDRIARNLAVRINPSSRIIEQFDNYFKKKKVEDPETEAFLFGALMDGISFNYVMNPDVFPVESVKKKIILDYLKIKD